MLQIIEQTREEKIAMYMKLPKKQIIEMLINCNDIITDLTQINGNIEAEPTCDSCGCHPNMLFTTKSGRFCGNCYSGIF